MCTGPHIQECFLKHQKKNGQIDLVIFMEERALCRYDTQILKLETEGYVIWMNLQNIMLNKIIKDTYSGIPFT